MIVINCPTILLHDLVWVGWRTTRRHHSHLVDVHSSGLLCRLAGELRVGIAHTYEGSRTHASCIELSSQPLSLVRLGEHLYSDSI